MKGVVSIVKELNRANAKETQSLLKGWFLSDSTNLQPTNPIEFYNLCYMVNEYVFATAAVSFFRLEPSAQLYNEEMYERYTRHLPINLYAYLNWIRQLIKSAKSDTPLSVIVHSEVFEELRKDIALLPKLLEYEGLYVSTVEAQLNEMSGINDNQRKIALYVYKYNQDNGYGPSYREIADGIGLSSTSSIYHNIQKLIRLGILTDNSRKSRALNYAG